MKVILLKFILKHLTLMTLGIHPHDAKSWDDDDCGAATLSSLTELANNAECVAIGECGLDFNRNFSPPATQLDVFEKQIQLACRLQKPLFLHERDAHEDMVRLLQKYKDQGNLPSCVIHCFCGTVEQAIKYLSMGCYIGLTGTSQKYLNWYRNI
jgi:TatD DNase family protein